MKINYLSMAATVALLTLVLLAQKNWASTGSLTTPAPIREQPINLVTLTVPNRLQQV